MPLGVIVLLVVAAVVYFGLAHRVLDRMRLTDSQALIFIGLMVAGSFLDIPIARRPLSVSVNVGGALVPAALAVFLLVKADTVWEKVRALLASVITAAAIFVVARTVDFGPEGGRGFIDPVLLFGLMAGVVGYLFGRSRRASFVAGTLGILLSDLGHLVQVASRGRASTVAIGGAGVFDTIVIAGVVAVLLAEVVGEARERLAGGPREGRTQQDPGRPGWFRKDKAPPGDPGDPEPKTGEQAGAHRSFFGGGGLEDLDDREERRETGDRPDEGSRGGEPADNSERDEDTAPRGVDGGGPKQNG